MAGPKGPLNGNAALERVRAAQAASPSVLTAGGLQVPVSAVQKCPFPRLQGFQARGQITPDMKRLLAYELQFGVQLGLDIGKTITVTLTPDMPARALVNTLRELAGRLEAMADDCEAEAARIQLDAATPAAPGAPGEPGPSKPEGA